MKNSVSCELKLQTINIGLFIGLLIEILIKVIIKMLVNIFFMWFLNYFVIHFRHGLVPNERSRRVIYIPMFKIPVNTHESNC